MKLLNQNFLQSMRPSQKKDESQDKEENTLIFYIAPLEISYAIQQFKISFGL